MKVNNDSIFINKKDLDNNFYNVEFFNKKKMSGDGNCFYRCISYHLFKTVENYKIIRETVYQYLKENTTFAYEYSYLKGDTYYTEVKEGDTNVEYKLIDYIEKIKEDKFFAGYIEIYCCTRIYKIPIIILEKTKVYDIHFYKLYTPFKDINENIENFNLKDIIYLKYKNGNHYDYLAINDKFIIDNINNKDKNDLSLNLNKNIINNNIKSENSSLDEDVELESKLSESSQKNEHINIISKVNIKNVNEISNNKKEDLYNNKNLNEIIKEIDLDIYKEYIKNYKQTEIEYNNDTRKIAKTIPKFPILIGKEINTNYYNDIYKYLFCKKYNISNIRRYPNDIYNIKKVSSKENKKKVIRG